jgi:hypothetical protein
MDSAWEAIFMLLVLKIPVVYLGVVVWWAIRAEPVADGGTDGDSTPIPLMPCGWDDWKRGRRDPSRWRRPLPGGGRTPRLQARRARTRPA